MNSNAIEYDIKWDSQQLSNNLMLLKVITIDDSKKLIEQEIDGWTLLLMKENDINSLGFLMGPKKRILNLIEDIKYRLKTKRKLIYSLPEPKPEFGGGDISWDLIKNVLNNRKPFNRSYSCSECGKNYSKNQYVIDHKMTIHYKSSTNYSCKVCGQTFGWRVTALKHVKKTHSQNKSQDMIEFLYQSN